MFDEKIRVETNIEEAPVALDRDNFLRSLIRELSGTLQDIVGLDEAAGFVSVVGAKIGDQIDRDYRLALGVDRLDRNQVALVLQDLKRRIQGRFKIVSADSEKIVLANTACPFGDKVIGRPSMCMMTSNVFGRVAANNLGYAKVELSETIADGHGRCHVVVHLSRELAAKADGREYFDALATGLKG